MYVSFTCIVLNVNAQKETFTPENVNGYVNSDFCLFFVLISQHAEWDLNKIEKTFNGTFTG